jgi:carotenoid cleavage dioxygenase-like enzyme
VLPPDAIPAIHDPEMVPVPDVGEDLDDDDKVIGVVIDGEARAYPIRVLSAHEIVNDEIHGRPIAVTW